MKILCVIPSRISSTRLPRKPLADIQGMPMIARVLKNAQACKVISKVIVATDSDEIAEVVRAHDGEFEMTDPLLLTGSDRVAAVAKKYSDMDVVINLQGDGPFITPRMLELLVEPYLKGETPDMTTLAYPLDMEKKYHEPGAVKVITDLNGYALYFSRAPIPYFRAEPNCAVPVYHHMGLYAFRRDFLMTYTTLPQTPLEKTELLEQLRAMEHGYRIRVCLTEEKAMEIDTPQDLLEAQHFLV